MNALESFYLLSAGASFSIYEYLIIKNNYLVMKKVKSKLKYKKGLSYECENLRKCMDKTIIKNIGINNAIFLGFSFMIPPVNFLLALYFKAREDCFTVWVDNLDEQCDLINEKETIHRKENSLMLKRIIKNEEIKDEVSDKEYEDSIKRKILLK